MNIAVIYNCESQTVVNLFRAANRIKHGLAPIRRIVSALKLRKRISDKSRFEPWDKLTNYAEAGE